MPKRPPGKDLQDLVTSIETTIAGSDEVKITSPKRLRDKDTGRLREHDVILEWQHEHRLVIGSIECRDRNRPIGVPDVEQFAKKCERTGVQVPIMVSSKGFYDTARRKAASLGVECLELRDAEKFSWAAPDLIIEFQQHYDALRVTVMCETSPAEPFELFDIEGNSAASDGLINLVREVFQPKNLEDLVGKSTPIHVVNVAKGWTVRDAEGQVHNVLRFEIKTSVSYTRHTRPVTHRTYASDRASYDVASSPVAIGDRTGTLMLVKGETSIRVAVKMDDGEPP